MLFFCYGVASVVLVSFSFLSSAFAQSTGSPNKKNEINFQCFFSQVYNAKEGSWEMHCRARGKMSVENIKDFLLTPGDSDDFFRFTCRDDDDRPFYKGPIGFGVAPQYIDDDGDNADGDRFNAIISGVKTTSPLIVVSEIDLRDFKKFREMRDEERDAVGTFSRYGKPYMLPGKCRFTREN